MMILKIKVEDDVENRRDDAESGSRRDDVENRR